MTSIVMRRIRIAHCKRGPERCQLCRELDEERICALDVDPPDRGLVQRRVIELGRGGESRWCEYDVVRVFADREEALEYARTHHVDDVELGE